ARKNQAIPWTVTITAAEAVQYLIASTIGINGKNRAADSRRAASQGRTVKGVGRQEQSAIRISPVAVVAASERVQCGKAGTIGVDLEYCAQVKGAPAHASPI